LIKSNRLAALLKVRPDEARLVLLVAALFLGIQASQGLGDNAASALFFLRFGVDYLPYMYLALGGLTFVAMLFYSAGLGRFRLQGFIPGLLAGFAALLLLERAGLGLNVSALYPLLWLTVSAGNMLLGTLVWNVAGEVCDARQAKRLFPLFTSAGILGSVLGNAATGAAAKGLGTENLLVLVAVLLGGVLLLSRSIGRSYFHAQGKPGGSTGLIGDMRAGLDFVRGSALMRLIALTSVLFSILFFTISFPFSKVASASFPDEAAVAGFLGTFSSIVTAATFLVSLLLANRVYARVGIVNSVLLLPITYLLGFAVFSLDYNLRGAMIARFAQLVVLSGLAGTAWNALFNVVPSGRRGQVLAFNNGVPSQAGVMLSGLLLILGERLLTAEQVFLMGGLVALLCAGLVLRMRSAYGQALVAALRAGRVEVFSAGEASFAGFLQDPAALQVALGALYDPKPSARRLAAEILGRMGAAAAVPALVKRLEDAEPEVRTSALLALEKLRALPARAAITACLQDADPGVRTQALAALVALEPQADLELAARLDGLLDDPDAEVRARAAELVARQGALPRAIACLTGLVESGSPGQSVPALAAIGRLAARILPTEMLGAVVEAIRTAGRRPSVVERRAACQALASFEGKYGLADLAACLSDPDGTVRSAAAAALRRVWPASRPVLLGLLEAGDPAAQSEALEALPPEDPEMKDALAAYVRGEIVRLRELRRQSSALPAAGQKVNLLRDSLQARILASEARLVRAVGLAGSPQNMELVRQSLQARRAGTRAAAIEAFETLGDKRLSRAILPLLEAEAQAGGPGEAGAALLELLAAPESWLRALAVQAVPELGWREYLPKLDALRTDPDPLVREAAADALSRLGEVNPMDTLQTLPTLERLLLLRDVPLFETLPPDDLKQVAEIARERLFADGETLCREGEAGDSLFIIVSGNVEVSREAGGNRRALALRGPGEVVGEMAIIESLPRMATLRARGEVRLLVIEGEAFKAILHDRPEVASALLVCLGRRLREAAG
jgi:HEAT repeat protein